MQGEYAIPALRWRSLIECSKPLLIWTRFLQTVSPGAGVVMESPFSLLLSFCSLLAVLPLTSVQAQSDESLLLVSSFAPLPDGGISCLKLNSSEGTLELLHKCGDIPQPFFFDVLPDQNLLCSIYAETFGGPPTEEIASWRLNPQDQKLQLINRSPTQGAASCFVELTRDGKSVLVANYSTGSVISFALQDGKLSAPVSFFQHQGSSVNNQRQQEPHAHCFVISPCGKYAIAADLGTDNLHCYRLDAVTGRLEPAELSLVPLPPGSGPRHLSFHPGGKSLSVINELANTITSFAWDAGSGTLKSLQTISTLPDDFAGVTHTADLKFTPDGRFLYGTNRGHDSIAMYGVQPNGMLKRIGIVDSHGAGPQNLAVSSDGRMLICANMPGKSVAAFRIDQSSGQLTFTAAVELAAPSCIRFLD